MSLNKLELTGRSRSHVVELVDPACVLHRDATSPFLEMRRAAGEEAGIDLAVVSGFRDFAAQQRIWNEKFQGRRKLYDRAGQLLDYAALTPAQLLEAILHWSAVPGGSRHHWGSEIDVIDRATLPPGEGARLLPAEFAATGPFARLNDWLTSNLHRWNFFRPYTTDRGGVSPEPWHLSYAPVSVPALRQLTEDVLRDALMENEIEGKSLLMTNLSVIYSRYIATIDIPAGQASIQ